MGTDFERATSTRLPDRFDLVFEQATTHSPHEYQKRIACGKRHERSDDAWMCEGSTCNSMLIDVPTGFGKTSAVVLAWLWNRSLKHRNDWPCRLIYCLPMRSLVEQTVQNASQWVEKLGLSDSVGIHVLMGGEASGKWDTEVEHDLILVGTQDMLISRALNRGYGMSRFRWPMHFGLLNNDCLWIMDEVQLMGPGLWTSAQLDWMRNDRFKCLKPCPTWWMSATISRNFLETRDRKNANLDEPEQVHLEAQDETHELFQARRPCDLWKPSRKTKGRRGKDSASSKLTEFTRELSDAVIAEHVTGSLSLVVCNTVSVAQQVFQQIKAAITDTGTSEVVLLTSRFRARDRMENQKKLLDFEVARKCALKDENISVPGLICVCTQVIEAGVDISARRLWSEIAPWSSTIQRLGRLNRDGRNNEDAKGFFWETPSTLSRGRQFIGPYETNVVKLGHDLIKEFTALCASGRILSAKETIARLSTNEETKAKVEQALTAVPGPFPRAIDVHGLFSTEPDVFGGFTDVSPFIRSVDKNADAMVFWRDWEADNRSLRKRILNGPPFSPDEGCAVAVSKLSEFLKTTSAWVWNDKLEVWELVRSQDIRPGMLVMVRRVDGGYSSELGWTGNKVDKLEKQLPPGEPHGQFADDAFSESGVWVALGDHLNDTEKEAERIVQALNLGDQVGSAVIHASSEHDIGKSLTLWQEGLPQPFPQVGEFWAKAPFQLAICSFGHEAVPKIEAILRVKNVKCCAAEPWDQGREGGTTQFTWHTGSKLSRDILEQIRSLSCVKHAWNVPFRPGFRHEAATALALWHRYFRGEETDFPALTIYLCAAHHGKVRTVLRSRSAAGDDVSGIPKTANSLPWKDMQLDFACAVDGASGYFTDDGQTFIFSAPGWTGLVSDLLGAWESNTDPGTSGAVPIGEPLDLGPFALAYLETLVRCADERASKTPDSSRELVS